MAHWSWDYDFEPSDDEGLEQAAQMFEATCRILRNARVMTPSRMQVDWDVDGRHSHVSSSIEADPGEALDASSLLYAVKKLRPSGVSGVTTGMVHTTGPGFWINSTGEDVEEDKLVEISFVYDDFGGHTWLSVYHDIWSRLSFSGESHEEIYLKNAPRLERIIRELENLFENETLRGDPTPYAIAEPYSVTLYPPE